MLASNVFATVDSYEKKLTLHLASLLVERTIYGEPKKENEKMALPFGRLYRQRSINAKNVSNYCVRKTCVKRKEKIVTVLNTHTHTHIDNHHHHLSTHQQKERSYHNKILFIAFTICATEFVAP